MSGAADQDLAKYRSGWQAVLRYLAMRGVLKALVSAEVRVHAVRSPRLAEVENGFVLVANHSSHLDTPVIAQHLPWRLAKHLSVGVAADYFFTNPVRKAFTRIMFNAFPIDRDGSRVNSGLSRRLLQHGVPILVFPEATRSRTGRMRKFSPGAAALAMANGDPVLPVALIGAFEAMPKGRNWPRPGRPLVTVVFGDPLYGAEQESASAFTRRVQQAIADLYAAHHPDGAGQPPPQEPQQKENGTK